MSEIYKSIAEAVRHGKLKEPFTSHDFKKACPGWTDGTYNAFLWKHRLGNPGGYVEFFKKISPGEFILLR